MTSATDFARSLDTHKRLVGEKLVHLRSSNGILSVASGSPSGLALVTRIPSADDVEATVELATLSSMTRGTDVTLSVSGESLSVKNKRASASLPLVTEEPPRIPKADKTVIDARDVDWLCGVLPRIAMTKLDKSGKLCAACDGSDWSLSCADDVHGAFSFAKGYSKLSFAFLPADAAVLQALLELAGEQRLTIGKTDNLLILRCDSFAASIPTIDEEPQSKETVTSGTKIVGQMSPKSLREALAVLAPFAASKDSPPPVVFKATPQKVTAAVSSPAGAVTQKVAAKFSTSVEFPLSYALLSNVAAKLGDDPVDVLVVRDDQKEITRLTLRDDDVDYLMLTAP